MPSLTLVMPSLLLHYQHTKVTPQVQEGTTYISSFLVDLCTEFVQVEMHRRIKAE